MYKFEAYTNIIQNRRVTAVTVKNRSQETVACKSSLTAACICVGSDLRKVSTFSMVEKKSKEQYNM